MILAARLQEEELMHAAQAASFEDDNNAVPAALPYGTSGTTTGGNANLQAHEAIPVAAYAYPSNAPPQQQPQQQQAGRSRWNPANWFSSSSSPSPAAAAAAPPPRYYAPGATQPQQQYLGSGPILIDPVWGPFTPQPPGAQQFTPMQMCGISCCPCCVPPMCIPARKEAWKRFCRSANFILAVFQTILVIISIALHGFSSSNSMWGPSPSTLNTLQGKNSAQIVYNYQLWRLVTPIALHAGLLHLAMNMLIQLRLGVLLEYQWGVVPYLWIYLGSGVCGSVYSAIFNADAIGVGASGALLGVFGAWMSHMFLHWRQGDEAVKRQRRLNFWMAIFNCLIIIAFSFSPLIDWAAHIGGLGGGVLLGFWYFGRALDGQVDFDFPSQSAQMAALSAPLSPNNSHHNNTRRLNYVGTTGGGGATATCCRAGNGTPSLWTRYCATSFNCSKEAFTPCTKGKGAVWFGLVGYFVVLVAGLLGLLFNTTPSRALLNVPPY
jgi:membrane associated rhomboid family serine protease